jgi:hypothetical protein
MITTVAAGQRLELRGTIIPSAKYGLPITADQDKWIALCKILTDIIRKEGHVTNPVSFTSADILRLLHKHRHSGKNYREIEEWLDVLFSTTIFSEGVVYLAQEKRRVKDRFRVFERAVSFGKELPDGKVADKNYVWFSDWQLQNINSNHLLPIDLEAYRELKNHIAKALVPLLQIWLYATRDEGVFEKRYNELCEMLNIRQYRYHSVIVQTLGPSLDELKQFGYIADWQIERTNDGDSYKIVLHHGEKFHRDRRARLNRRPTSTTRLQGTERLNGGQTGSPNHQPKTDSNASQPTVDPQLISQFTRRGITTDKAVAILANLQPGRDFVAQLEHAEQIVQRSQVPIKNPAGYILKLIELNTPVPDGFETSAKRKAREERELRERDRRAADDAQEQIQLDYENYRDLVTDRYIQANPAVFEAIKEAKRNDGKRFSFSTESMARLEARYEIRKQISFLTLEEFVERRRHGHDFSLKPVGPSPESGTPAAVVPEDLLAAEELRDAENNRRNIAEQPATNLASPSIVQPPTDLWVAELAAAQNITGIAPLESASIIQSEAAPQPPEPAMETSIAAPEDPPAAHELPEVSMIGPSTPAAEVPAEKVAEPAAVPVESAPLMIELFSNPPQEELSDIIDRDEAA